MPLSSTAALRLIDAIAILLAQSYQLARSRLASAASPVMRLVMQRDHVLSNVHLLRRELAILRAQRQSLPPHRRPDYEPEQRLAIVQLLRLRGWSIRKAARRFVIHPNTLRSWIAAVEGRGNLRLLADAVAWHRIDDVLRYTVQQMRRLCPEPELGTRTIARHLIRAGLAISRSSVQRVLREKLPQRPSRRARPAMAQPAGVEPHHLLRPKLPNQVWHIDLTSLRFLWFRFTAVGILDGFSRKLLQLRLYVRTPRQRELITLVRRTVKESGRLRFVISDHGTQFRRRFHADMSRLKIHHVRGRVRAPYLNGKLERLFCTFRVWWRLLLPGISRPHLQRRLDDFRIWYNQHRPHSATGGRTPEEAWTEAELPEPIPIRQADPIKPTIRVRRLRCRGDPNLPIFQIEVRKAA